MDVTIRRASPLQGTLTVPPDKAICHRAVLLSALAQGPTEIRPWPSAEDAQRTLALVASLGVAATRSGDAVTISGQGPDGLRAAQGELFCGESGTTLRLATGLLAGQPFLSRLSAGPSLARRPMQRIAEPLSRMGARVDGVVSAGDSRELYPPLTIHGARPLRAIRYAMDVASAQVKSAILLAGLCADGRTTVVEQLPTRDHTERALRVFGARIEQDGRAVSVAPGPLQSPGSLTLPGDFSSAAFFIVAASCVPGSHLELLEVGLNPSRIGALRVLERMGAGVRQAVTDDRWEPRGTVSVEARPLRAVTVEADEAPAVIDELPILMVAAACARGTSRFRGLGELRVKETDRIQSMVSGLRQLGARIHLSAPDTVEIEGTPLVGGVVSSAGDHRTAMSLAVAGLSASGSSTTVQGAECVAKSFPEFFELLSRLGSSSTGGRVLI